MNYSWKEKKVAILGWGINGLDAAKYLLKQGADITIFDQKDKKSLDCSGFDINKVKLSLGRDYIKGGLINYDYVFRAPGVYRYLPEIIKAEKKGVIISSVVKLFFDLCPAKIIGVTGTKGKGTTSTLIYEILRKEGKDVYMAGNIGNPMLELLPKLSSSSWVVLELSSFQLIDLVKSPHIAVVLNITSDHLDWHKNKKEYIEAKSNVIRHQGSRDFAVLNYDYEISKSFRKYTKATIFYFSKKKDVKGGYVKDGKIILDIGNKKYEIGKTKDLFLRGEHNWENICAAGLSAFIAGTGIDAIKKTVFSFKGLEHRLELVRTVNKISFYNDSFSTNPQTTIAAVKSFKEPITIILGGFDKKLNFDQMGKEIIKSTVKNVILIGDISNKIKKSLIKTNFSGNMFEMGYSSMKNIVKNAYKISKSGGIVLLSPASSSFDMFSDYKDRGHQFKTAVRNL